MQKKIIEFNQVQRKDTKIDFQSGDIVKVYKKIKEGDKERIQVFEGMIIAIKGRQSSSPMITIRKISSGVGVEIIIPLLSPSIEKIELVKKTTARRAKLYFTRKSSNKNSI